MNGLYKFGFLAHGVSWLSNIRARTWLTLAAIGLVFVGLVVWAGIAILSWLWGQAPVVAGAGKRLAGNAIKQVEQVAPGLRQQAEQWVPGAKEQAAQWLPAGVKEQAGKWLPGLGADVPANDVSGTDVGPMPRFPGLMRSHFERTGQTVEARYAGRAAFEVVLAHYVQGFAAAGFTQEVISATTEGEKHRFRRGDEFIDLALLRRPGGLLELRLQGPTH